jgi:ABC-type Zn uptake system ZnuABC Zn-binding protein ZnuA
MLKVSHSSKIIIGLMILGFTLIGCQSSQPAAAPSDELTVLTTTSFISDTVQQITGDRVTVNVLLEPGQNPHAFQPAPRDLVLAAEADVIFANGLELESFLDDLMEGAENQEALVIVSRDITPLMAVNGHDHNLEEAHQEGDDHSEEEHEEDHEGDETHDEDSHQEDSLAGADPHVWLDPNNLISWVEVITAELVRLDPENAAFYQENASRYQEELGNLDRWIEEQVAGIPEENRELVTDHTAFGYFAEEYGFQQIGAVIPAPTTEAETSGLQLAELMETVEEYDVRAIFVSDESDSELSRRLAEDSGVDLVPLYLGSLTDGGPADTYLDFMRYNVSSIADALQ